MNTSKCFRFRPLRLVALAMVWGGMVAAAGAADLAARLPRNSCLVLRTSDVAATCRAFQTTPFGATLCGADFAPLVAELRNRDRGGPLHLRPWIGFDWPELADTKSSAAMAAFPLQDGSAGVVWLFSDEASKDALRKSVGDYFGAKKWRAVEKKNAGATIITFEPPAQLKEPARVWFEADGIYGVADSSRAAQALLATKPDASFASLPVGKPLPEAAAADLHFYVQPLVFWKALKAPAPGKALRLREPVLVAERLGLGGITEIDGSVQFAPQNGGQWQIMANVVAPQPYPKALKALDLLPGPAIALPGWIDANASSIASWRWNFVTGMQAFGHLFDEASDPGPAGEGLFEQVLDGLRDDPEGPRIDMRKELFPKLGPEVLTASQPGRSLTVVGILPQHMPDVRDFLKRFFKDDNEVVYQRIGEVDLWSGKAGAPIFADTGEPSEASIRAVAIGLDRLWIATDPDSLKDLLPIAAKGDTAKPLSATPAWRTYTAWRSEHETKTTAYDSFTRPSLAWRTAYEDARTVKQGKAKDSTAAKVWLFLLFGTTERTADLPFAVVPKFATWSGKLSDTGLILSKTKEGWGTIIGPLSGTSD